MVWWFGAHSAPNHHAHLLPPLFIHLSFAFPISSIISFRASASHCDIKVAVTPLPVKDSSGASPYNILFLYGWRKSVYWGWRWHCYEANAVGGVPLGPPHRGLVCRMARVKHGSGLGCPKNQSTPGLTIALVFFSIINLLSWMCLRKTNLLYWDTHF